MPSFELLPTPIQGCFEIQPIVRQDNRGYFVKTFVQSEFMALGLTTQFVEQYHSLSHAGVIRGMHFQKPPHAHNKLVYCTAGRVLDAVVDLRQGSPTFRQIHTLELNAKQGKMLFVPTGLAHGFEALENNTLMVYHVSSEYAPSHDAGIHWQSMLIPWTTKSPIVSARDAAFETLAAFQSPFTWNPS